MRFLFCVILIVTLFSTGNSNAQVKVSRIDVGKWVKDNFAGQGVVIGHIRVHGDALSQGSFTSSNNVLEIKKGLVLSTGSAFSVPGFNNKSNQSYSFGDAEKDPDLQKYVKPNLYDVSLIEFDFVPLANSLQFKYQFGSEEYPEYVGSTYNDVFGFFISDDKEKSNIALIPGENVPVSINTVNHLTNARYFTDNNVFPVSGRREAPIEEAEPAGFWSKIKTVFGGGKTSNSEDPSSRADPALVKKTNSSVYRFLQFDGITKKLAAHAFVTPYKKYHMKIIIADVADNIFDSGVFIEDQSLVVSRDTSQSDFVDYPNISKSVDPAQLLAGKKLQDILPDTLTFENANIYFDFDKSEVLPVEIRKLKGVVALYERIKAKYTIEITGHTDSIGNLNYNMALSRKRNQAVISSLQKLKLVDAPIEITENAFLKPVATNETEDGRVKNRRVEIFFVKREN